MAAWHLSSNDHVAASEIEGGIARSLSGFSRLGVFYIVFAAINILVYTLNIFNEQIANIFAASRATPWGVITSIFVHVDPDRLVMNLAGLASFLLIFAFTNFHLPYAAKVQRTKFFLMAVFGAAILANLFWIVVADLRSMGASGLIYAAEGGVAGFSLLNLWQLYNKIRHKEGVERWGFFLNLIVLLTLVAWMMLSLTSFLGYERDVNVFIHGFSFVFALVISLESMNIQFSRTQGKP